MTANYAIAVQGTLDAPSIIVSQETQTNLGPTYALMVLPSLASAQDLIDGLSEAIAKASDRSAIPHFKAST